MPTIAEIAQRSRSEVAAHFLDAGATSPQNALAYLMGQGVVRLTQEGRHWIDADAAEAWKRETTTRVALVAGGALAAVAGLVLWRRYRNR